MDPLARLLADPANERSRAVVVVAHPDDEVLGCGALLARLPAARVVHVTDGAPRDTADARRHGFSTRGTYAARRAAEAEAALAMAGHPAACLVRLGIADQEASLHLADIARALGPALSEAAIVLTHAYEGGHCDHDAVAFAVAAALRLRGGAPPLLVEMPFYRAVLAQDEAARRRPSETPALRDLPAGGTPDTGDPSSSWMRQRFLPHPDAGPVRLLTLNPSEQTLKRRMMAAHGTQKATLEAFSVAAEPFRVAPPYEFSRLPHGGDLLYERHGWNLTGRVWLDRVRAARAALGWGGSP